MEKWPGCFNPSNDPVDEANNDRILSMSCPTNVQVELFEANNAKTENYRKKQHAFDNLSYQHRRRMQITVIEANYNKLTGLKNAENPFGLEQQYKNIFKMAKASLEVECSTDKCCTNCDNDETRIILIPTENADLASFNKYKSQM